jgi:DHA1 family putative efflux transporter-like MFS transporter
MGETSASEPGMLTTVALFAANFGVTPTQMVITLFLLDIAETFGAPAGVVGQVQTLSSAIAVVVALLTGVLTVRFKPRTLLIVGVMSIGISALGCFFSVNFGMLLVAYAFSGLGMAMAMPMNMTLVAELYPSERRTGVLGIINTGMTMGYLVGPPIVNYFAVIGGWRASMLYYVLPITVTSLLLILRGVPKTKDKAVETSTVGVLDGFRGVFTVRSAVWCLAAAAIMMFSWQFLALYSISFYRERFLISTGMASLVLLTMSVCTTLGNLVVGRAVRRYGRRRIAVLSSVFCAVFLVGFAVMPSFMLSLAVRLLTGLAGPFAYTASSSLALEMVPSFRGVMMAMNSAAFQMGTSVGAAVGGVMLLSYSYETVGVVLGAFMLVPAFIYHFMIRDP